MATVIAIATEGTAVTSVISTIAATIAGTATVTATAATATAPIVIAVVDVRKPRSACPHLAKAPRPANRAARATIRAVVGTVTTAGTSVIAGFTVATRRIAVAMAEDAVVAVVTAVGKP